MRLKEIHELAVKMGIEADPRPRAEIDQALKQINEKHEKMSIDEKKLFDEEKLTNPYSDTRILNGSGDEEIAGLIVGVDMEVGEVVLADRLREKGENIDLILTHHPEGKALANLSDVMKMQADIWHENGVPINIGEALIIPRMKEVFRRLLPVNHSRAIDAAKLLSFPFMSCHTPADNLVTGFLTKIIKAENPRTLKEIIKLLKAIPEYENAAKEGAGPMILVGDDNNRAGKILVDMTGGTEGPKEVIEKLSAAGVGTLVGMHMGDKLKEEAEKHKINVIIAGHIASDTVGMNLFLDEIEKKGVKAITCSGITRIKRS
jgi:putative NIF3 family GTP cyclohydrolase 1 type 2